MEMLIDNFDNDDYATDLKAICENLSKPMSHTHKLGRSCMTHRYAEHLKIELAILFELHINAE
jgi:hypothetical protein